jgi:hypothetical protein
MPLAPAPITTPSAAAAVWRIGIRIGFLLGFAAVYAFTHFYQTAPATLHDRARSYLPPTPGWLIGVECAFLLCPFLAAFVLLLQKRNQTLTASGAGIAFGLFGCFLLLSPFVLLSLFLYLGLSANQMTSAADPGLKHAALALVALVGISAWIVLCAILNGKNQMSVFCIAVVATVIYLSIGWGKLRTTEYHVGQQQQRAAETLNTVTVQTYFGAHRVLARLAGCLIEYQAANSNAGFPASLDALPRDTHLPDGTVCDVSGVAPNSVPGYTFTYTPQHNSSSGSYTDFRLVAMPLKKGSPHVDPMAVDRRGRIFAYTGWAVTDRQPDFTPQLVASPDDLNASQLLSLRSEIRSFVQNNGGQPPAMLSSLGWLAAKNASDPEKMRVGPYQLQYIPNIRSENGYTLAAVCQSYGVDCLRSFYVDQDGETHQTAEPRPATYNDDLIPDCEKFAQTCLDIDWPMP